MAFIISLHLEKAMGSPVAFFVSERELKRQNRRERREKMIREAIQKVIARQNLDEAEMEEAMREITNGLASPEQIASFVTALRMKGETPIEIAAAAKVIREKALKVDGGGEVVSLDREEITVEKETILRTTTGGTGGTKVFNISTATALIAAGRGVKVAKSVRRSTPGFCGCADVLDALGFHLDMTPSQIERCLREIGLCFIYDPLAGNGLSHLVSVRERIGIRTIFNLVDPLINPAQARTQLLGVYEPELTETMAAVLRNLGIKKALVFCGEDTLDEITLTGKTKVTFLQEDHMKTYFIEPDDFGMRKATLKDIEGGTRTRNAEIISAILKGEQGPRRDIAVLNAAAVFTVAGKAQDLSQGLDLANESIDSGAAFEKLEHLIRFGRGEQRFLRSHLELHV